MRNYFGTWAAIALTAATPCLEQPATAATSGNLGPQRPPLPSITWVDALGGNTKFSTRTFSKWIWARASKDAPVESPVLRTWVELLPGYRLRAWEGTALRVTVHPRDNPLGAGRGEFISLDTNAPNTKASFQMLDPTNKLTQVGLLIRIPVDRPFFWLDESCTLQNVEVGSRPTPLKYLFTAASCVPSGNDLDVFLMHSPDAQLVDSSLPNKIASGNVWTQYRVRLPPKSSMVTRVLGRFRMGKKGEASALSEGIVFYEPDVVKPGLFASAGLGLTVLTYSETPVDISLVETALTVKISGGYRIIPRVLDIAANAFINALPIVTFPIGTDPARFYGVNGRVAWRLPLRLGGADWSLMGGWYLWGMIVPSGAYGITYLAGPQVFFSVRKPFAGHHSVYGYFKFAPISDTFSISLANREIALGAGYSPGSQMWGKNWGLTLDFSNAAFTSNTSMVTNGMSTTTISLGIQRDL